MENRNPPPGALARLGAAALVLAVVLSIAVPAVLVVNQRWFGDERVNDALRPAWCERELLCALALPPYFLAIFVATGALLLLALAGRDLLELPREVARAAPRPLASLLGAGVAHVLLMATIGVLYAGHWLAWPLAALTAAAALLLLRRNGAPPIFWIWSLGLILGAVWVNGWWFAVIGDEFAFYQYAAEYMGTPAEIPSRIFNGTAVYGAHPYFSSLLQTISLWIFGYGSFGWRFSSIYLGAMAIPLLYSFQRSFLPERSALLAAMLLACSHYLLSFGKIGYNNLQALWALGLALAAAAWAIRSGHWRAYGALGVTFALCFYVYPAALYVPPVVLLLLLVYAPPWGRQGARLAVVGRWALSGGVALALVAPLLLQPMYWEAKLAGTAFYSPERVNSVQAVAWHLGSNLLYSLYAGFYVPSESHFVSVGYLDPATAGLALAGLALALAALRRSRFVLFLLLSYAAMLFLAGASHDREFPSTTRMFLLLPWLCIFAALALSWLGAALRLAGLPPRVVAGLGAVALVAILALNFYVAYPLSHQRMASQYQQLETLLLRTAMRAEATTALRGSHFVLVNDPQSLHAPALRGLLALYRPATPQEIVELVIGPTPAATVNESQLLSPQAIVLISPRIDDTYSVFLARFLSQHGRSACPIITSRGEVRFTVWLPEAAVGVCGPLNAAPFRPFVPEALQGR